MPLNYSSMEQVSAWRFLRHRVSVAVGRHSVRLVHDPSRNASASMLVGVVAALLGLGVCFVISWLRPSGLAGENDAILADRATGEVYVVVGDRVHPALNLGSARLIAGSDSNPKMVPIAEIEKRPIGPIVGIVGAPSDLVVDNPPNAGWGLCDRLTGGLGSQVSPKVTILSGLTDFGQWAHPVDSPEAALMTYGGDTYLVTDGRRSKIDLADKPVTLALGIQAGALQTAPMSRALYEALLPTAPLRVPDVPNPGGPVGYATAAVPTVSGSVLKVDSEASDGAQFFVALPAGVQLIPETVALTLLNANLSGQAKMLHTDAATVTGLPQAVGFDVSMYPKGPLTLLDKSAEPVTCVLWRKGSGEPHAEITTVSGRRLPIPLGDDSRVMSLVSGPQHGSADSVYIGENSANFVQVTGVEPDSVRSESLWWISSSGVRFGIQTAGDGENQTLNALGLEGIAAAPAPWAVIRWLPAGPTLSHAAAMTQHDTFIADTPARRLQKPGAGQ